MTTIYTVCKVKVDRMKKLITIALALALVSSFVFVKNLRAATTGAVTATVTAQQIAITVADGTVTYGTLALSGSANTTAAGINNTQIATNTGNITENFNIKGSASSGGWTLAATIGSEQYKHEFCIGSGGTPDPCDAGGTPVWTALTTNDQTLASGISSSGTQKFDLKVTVPSATTQTTPQNVNVTVTAVAP